MAEGPPPEDFSKLSIEAKLAHKVWKARSMGYEEATKLFKRIDDESSPEYNPYTPLVRKFPVEANAVAQEKALEATLAFVEFASAAGKICSEVVAGIVTKCLNARTKTKELGVSICLMYVETEKQDLVIEEILKGLSNKQPKIVAACIGVVTRIVKEFGVGVLNIKLMLKSVPSMFDHSDKNVRAEAKALAIELYRWVGVALKASIDGKLKPIQMKELEEEFGKLTDSDRPAPTRLLRSQQAVAASAPPTADTDPDESSGGAVAMVTAPAIDPYDLLEAVNVLGKMPKDFYEKIVDTKWKERKEALEALLPLAQSPKIEEGDYGELIKTLKKVITKDSNVLVVALAGNVLTGLAKGLRKKYGPYASVSLAAIFEKFKEKKLNVVTSLREASDSIFVTTTLTNLQDDVLEALANKNPSVKSEVLLFLSRCYSQCVPAMIPKPYLKAMCPVVVQRLDDTTPQVRDSACEVLGTLLKLLGERAMNNYLEGIDKTRMTKINECMEKVELKAPPPGMAPPPQAAPAKQPAKEVKKEAPPTDEAEPPKKKPAQKKKKKVEEEPEKKEAPPKKKPAAEKKPPPSSGGGASKSKGKGGGGAVGKFDEPPDVSEPNIADEEIEDKANDVLPDGLLARLAETAWKERLAGHESFKEFVEGQPPDAMQSILFIKILARKPGWKDSNFQVMKAKFQLITVLAEKAKVFGKRSTSLVIPPLVDKFSDLKLKGQCSETLLMIAERMTLNYTSLQVMKAAFEHKSPKVQSESLEWLSQGLKEFGFLLNVKPHVDYIKKGLAASNPAVRTAAINLLGTMCMYMGAQLRMFFEGEKAALLQQIDAVFEKSSGESPPAPVRGPNIKSGEEEEEGEGGGGGGGGGGGASLSLADLMPKVDISPKMTTELMKELADKNWKIRGEALQKIQEIIAAAKFISPSLGDLPSGLKGRLSDSNKNLVITTLSIIGTLATSIGPSCSKFNKIFIPAVIQALTDSKPQVRTAGTACLSTWVGEIGLASLVEQDLLAPSLATENPNLRTELLGWLEERLPNENKLPSEIANVVQPVYSCLEDRSADVRKKAQAVLPLLMVPVGYDTMLKHTGKLKPASKQLVKGLLDKHRPSLPSPPSSSSSSSAKSTDAKTKKPKADSSSSPKEPTKARQASKASKTGGQVDDDTPPLILVPKAKEQRMKDDEKMKVLKWNFQMPRPEHIDQLKDQMLTCVSLQIHKKLFHEDFKQQLQAVSSLTAAVSSDVDTAISCSDLLLRWITLRFFDTNTTVNVKCLEFVQHLFVSMSGVSYKLSDYEAAGFLPYLINKVGDPKDAVRKAVRALFRTIWSIYPPGKMFNFVTDGLKSKNARQRIECLEVIGEMIKNNGMTVCQPSPAKSLPVVAGQICDRDNGVRSAAINTMVVVYGYVGEGVYKFASQLSEKEISLLEERIKRSGKTVQPFKPAKSPSPSPVSTPEPHPLTEQPVKSKSPSPVPPEPAPVSKVTVSPRSGIPKFSGPFSVDVSKYKAPASKLARPKVPRPDLSVFGKEEKMTEYATSKLIRHPPKALSISPARQTLASTSSVVSYIIAQITGPDIDTVSDAVLRIEKITSDQPSLLLTHVDQLIRAILMQKRFNFTTRMSGAANGGDYSKILEISRLLTSVLVQTFSDKTLAQSVHQETLVELERDIFGYLIDEKLLCIDNIEQLNRAYNLLMGHIVEHTNRNAIFGSLLQVMLESLTPEGSGTKLSEMSMKCLWRLTRQLNAMMSNVDIDVLLRDIDVFLNGYSSLNPSPSSDDKPYRTVKTILYHLAKSLKSEVLNHLSLIKDRTSSPVVIYLNKTVRKSNHKSSPEQLIKINNDEQVKDPPTVPPKVETKIVENTLTRNELSAELASCLTCIFETIKDPQSTREGMEELYDFIQTHPDIDFESMWASTSPFYQSYIKRGLRNVELWRQTGDKTQPIESETCAEIRKELEEVRERANPLMGINWEPLSVNSASRQVPLSLAAALADENKDPTATIIVTKKATHVITDGTATITKRKGGGPPGAGGVPPAAAGSSKLDDIRKRLDRLKAGQY